MLVETAIKLRIEEIIGSPATPVYVDVLPQDPVYPCVCVRLISQLPSLYTLGGTTRIEQALIQVDAFDEESTGVDPYAGATALAERVNGSVATCPGLSGYRGTVEDAASPPDSMGIRGCFRQDRRRQYDPEELRITTISQDYKVWYTPA